jgi:WD40 repeat protein
MRDDLQGWLRFLTAESHILVERPRLLFQQAANQPDGTAPARAAQHRQAAGLETRPWLRWVNKPQVRSACLMTLGGHRERPTTCAFSPDGRRIASAYSNGTLKLWDAVTGEEGATLVGHMRAVTACAFSPDGRRLVSASADDDILPADSTVRLWDGATGAILGVLVGHTSAVSACTFSPDGRHIASDSRDGTARIWDVASGAPRAVCRGGGGLCMFSPDGRRLVSAVPHGALIVTDVETGAEHVRLAGGLTPCACSPDGRRIVSACEGYTLKVWDIERDQATLTLAGHGDRLQACAFSPDGSRIASVSRDGTLKLWDASSGELLTTLTGRRPHGSLVLFSPNGSLLLSIADDESVIVSDVTAMTDRARLAHARSPCAFSPDGTLIVSGSADGGMQVWEIGADSKPAPASRHELMWHDCVFSPDGRYIASVSESPEAPVKIWDGTTGAEIATLPSKGGGTGANSCSFLPDGNRLVADCARDGLMILTLDADTDPIILKGASVPFAVFPDGRRLGAASSFGGGPIRIWDVQTRAALAALGTSDIGGRGMRVLPPCLCTADGTRMLTAGPDRTLILWDAATFAKLTTLADSGRKNIVCAFSPDGSRVAGWSDELTVAIWNAATGELSMTLAGHTGTVRRCAFSPDGGLIASASDDRTLRVWDATTGRLRAELIGHTEPVHACAFTPDGRRLASASSDGTVRTWEVATGTALSEYRPAGWVNGVSWSPDGRYLVAGTSLDVVHLLTEENVVNTAIVS